MRVCEWEASVSALGLKKYVPKKVCSISYLWLHDVIIDLITLVPFAWSSMFSNWSDIYDMIGILVSVLVFSIICLTQLQFSIDLPYWCLIRQTERFLVCPHSDLPSGQFHVPSFHWIEQLTDSKNIFYSIIVESFPFFRNASIRRTELRSERIGL